MPLVNLRNKKTFQIKCENDILWEEEFTNHINICHIGKKPYKCNQRENKISLNKELTSHMDDLHEAKKPYKCYKCEHELAFEEEITNHTNHLHVG